MQMLVTTSGKGETCSSVTCFPSSPLVPSQSSQLCPCPLQSSVFLLCSLVSSHSIAQFVDFSSPLCSLSFLHGKPHHCNLELNTLHLILPQSYLKKKTQFHGPQIIKTNPLQKKKGIINNILSFDSFRDSCITYNRCVRNPRLKCKIISMKKHVIEFEKRKACQSPPHKKLTFSYMQSAS